MRVNEAGLYKLILGTTKVRAEMGLRRRASRLSDAREPTPSGGDSCIKTDEQLPAHPPRCSVAGDDARGSGAKLRG